jgi:DNA-binding transcriptional MerR regulator
MSKSLKRQQALAFEMPAIPDKIYFTIGEASDLCDVKPHVLRYWETEFSILAPVKRKGNRRYYTQKDIHLIIDIKTLLYRDGFTIEGARLALKKKTKSSDKESLTLHSIITQPDPVSSQITTPVQTVLNIMEEEIA